MSNTTNSDQEFVDQSQHKTVACGDNLLGGLTEGPDDPELRRFLDERKEQRRLKRLAQPAKWESDPPTTKQLAYLRFLGHQSQVMTKGEAAEIISRLVEGIRA